MKEYKVVVSIPQIVSVQANSEEQAIEIVLNQIQDPRQRAIADVQVAIEVELDAE